MLSEMFRKLISPSQVIDGIERGIAGRQEDDCRDSVGPEEVTVARGKNGKDGVEDNVKYWEWYCRCVPSTLT